MELQHSLIELADQYVRKIFKEEVPANYHFHNLHHTLGVVDAVKHISSNSTLTNEDSTALLLAAWFHDTGYSKTYEGHELASVEIAETFLHSKLAEEALIQKVKNCILSTQMPHNPQTEIQKILCDADLYHLGSTHFPDEHKLLRKEWIEVFGKQIDKRDWRRNNISFLKKHEYFTDYAKKNLEPLKQAHLLRLKEKEKFDNYSHPLPTYNPENTEEVIKALGRNNIDTQKEEAKTKNYENRKERGIATMFRIMSDNHVSLSQMADSKANIMISVNTIVLSILVSVLLGKLQYYPQFVIPTVILALACLMAVTFAILATRPNVNKGVFNKQDIRLKKVNLLFFGNFFKMDLPDYEWAMKEMMSDSDYLYGSMIKDIYFLGKVLAKKYQYLRLSYNIFMVGLIAAIISFGIAAVVSIK